MEIFCQLHEEQTTIVLVTHEKRLPFIAAGFILRDAGWKEEAVIAAQAPGLQEEKS